MTDILQVLSDEEGLSAAAGREGIGVYIETLRRARREIIRLRLILDGAEEEFPMTRRLSFAAAIQSQ